MTNIALTIVSTYSAVTYIHCQQYHFLLTPLEFPNNLEQSCCGTILGAQIRWKKFFTIHNYHFKHNFNKVLKEL